MKNTATQRNLVIVLFVLVLVIFSFAERDSKGLERLYTWNLEKKSNATAASNQTPVTSLNK